MPKAEAIVNLGRPKRGEPARSVVVACATCGQSFRRELAALNKHGDAPRQFCSRKCFGLGRRGAACPGWKGGKVLVPCAQCGKTIARPQHALRRSDRHYCGRQCQAAGRKKHQSHQAARREAERRRRALKRASRRDIGFHTRGEWDDLVCRAKGRCVKCRKKTVLTRDHIIPLSKGGDDLIANIQPLCGPCNNAKRARVETLL